MNYLPNPLMQGFDPYGGAGMPGMFPGMGGGVNPRTAMRSLAPFLAQVLRMQQQTQLDTDQRLADKSIDFDESAYYNKPGAPPPHFMGMSAAQRYRDMEMRQMALTDSLQAKANARREAQAALDAVPEQQRHDEAMAAQGYNVAKDNFSFDVEGNQSPKYITIENSRYGEGTSKPITGVKSMYLGAKTNTPALLTGPSLREVFQRASNAGSQSAGVGSLPLPQAGFMGTKDTSSPMSVINPALEAAALALRKNKPRVR